MERSGPAADSVDGAVSVKEWTKVTREVTFSAMTTHRDNGRMVIRSLIADFGGPAKMAKALEVNPQRIIHWRNRGQVSAPMAPRVVEKAHDLGIDISLHDLRPDIYPPSAGMEAS